MTPWEEEYVVDLLSCYVLFWVSSFTLLQSPEFRDSGAWSAYTRLSTAPLGK
jgi:hypothetical protein